MKRLSTVPHGIVWPASRLQAHIAASQVYTYTCRCNNKINIKSTCTHSDYVYYFQNYYEPIVRLVSVLVLALKSTL